MIKVWIYFKPQILFTLLILGLFVAALQMKTVVVSNNITIVSVPVLTVVPEVSNIPDFGAIVDIELKKQSFFAFIRPHIDQENREILQNRKTLKSIYSKVLSGRGISSSDSYFLSNISLAYEMETTDRETLTHIRQVLKRLDVIPPSLVLAQAANESAWGTSRFARYGYNFFGQWCYSQGCGFVPSRRGEGEIHEVRRFASVGESVHAYFMNLNTFPSYEGLREIRQQLRDNQKSIDGISLTEGLQSYSERGEEYIWELQSMIYSNELTLLDDVCG